MCISPLLFTIYWETIFTRALQDEVDGIKIKRAVVNKIRYADDTVVIADASEGSQRLMDKIVTQRDTIS